jgi:hypothetical protein
MKRGTHGRMFRIVFQNYLRLNSNFSVGALKEINIKTIKSFWPCNNKTQIDTAKKLTFFR